MTTLSLAKKERVQRLQMQQALKRSAGMLKGKFKEDPVKWQRHMRKDRSFELPTETFQGAKSFLQRLSSGEPDLNTRSIDLKQL